MKMKCENIVTCGNYNCGLNYDGACIRTVIALDSDGKCVMYKPKNKSIPEVKTITKFPDGTESETTTIII
jgi:hypothetical protein